MHRFRPLLAFLAGLVAAGLTIAVVEAVAHGAVSGEALFGAVAAGYGLGALVGGVVANRLSPARWPGIVVTLALAALALLNLVTIAHPVWFVPVAALALAAGHLAAGRLARRH